MIMEAESIWMDFLHADNCSTIKTTVHVINAVNYLMLQLCVRTQAKNRAHTVLIPHRHILGDYPPTFSRRALTSKQLRYSAGRTKSFTLRDFKLGIGKN